MSDRLRIGIVVGEASGDILGAGLMTALRKHFPNAEFSGIGGPRMLALGFHSFFPQDRLAVMGLVEPLKRLPELLKIRAFLRDHFIANPPAVFIGIDAPDFNLTLEGDLKEKGILTAHYVSPSVWAWRQKRVHKIARSVDLMLTLLPFEAEFYQQHQVPVAFVGHHLADEIPLDVDQQAARNTLHIAQDAKVVALLPGSRSNEVERLGQLFMETAVHCLRRNPALQFIIPAANADRYRQLHLQLSSYIDYPIHLVNGQSQTVMAAADVVLMASGTTALEAMLLKRPMVIAYKLSWLSWAILSRMVKTPYVGLPNLLAGKKLVPELLQDDATPENMSAAVMHYFEHPQETQALRDTFYDMHQSIKRHASDRAADAIAELIQTKELQHDAT
ncbi:lipid-A-disaccharide synthase [Cellvibrio sp. PSBB006]|uniref:lipid-A-disaccharide synthase n=1 Tax=Cellvibrio sp. PSBB006 TaxID=1987723 RepID=UPI000B3B6865|nr:lipid-A-disaccharide synthase [Cellvibrio sp. PSBB006]ARU27344.1 lipid-A-disaccharide synthase [Cellvibrio sp. PSBB006]